MGTSTEALPTLRDPTCTLVLPTLDEAEAVPGLAELARRLAAVGVFDDVVVFDGGSTDDTVAAAHAHGLRVVTAASRAPGLPVLGKGDSMWRASDLPGDVLVFRDADVIGTGVDELVALASAACAPGVALVKGSFERLQFADGPPRPTSGRITEFVARPLLALLAPELAHVAEPLGGQIAIRRDVLRAVEVVTRYGVDVGLLLAVADRHGPGAVVDLDIGSLTHRSKRDASLVPMAHDVSATILHARAAAAMPDGVTADGPETSAIPLGADPTAGDGAYVARRLPCRGPQGWLVVRPPRRDMSTEAPRMDVVHGPTATGSLQ